MKFAEIQEKAKADWEALEKSRKPRIIVGTATCGRAAGALDVIDSIKAALSKHNIDADIMHDVFLDRKKPGVAVARRELLLKGPVIAFSKIIPLFDIAPVLYREHLAEIGYGIYAREAGKALPKEEVMSGQVFKGEAIPLVQLSGLEKFGTKVVNGLAYGMGYLVGLLRYRLFKKLSLFGVLSEMSRGLEAATPPEEKNPPQG